MVELQATDEDNMFIAKVKVELQATDEDSMFIAKVKVELQATDEDTTSHGQSWAARPSRTVDFVHENFPRELADDRAVTKVDLVLGYIKERALTYTVLWKELLQGFAPSPLGGHRQQTLARCFYGLCVHWCRHPYRSRKQHRNV
nr:hypothetical protein BgiMline_033110 [Biomphalaria glabrata]